MREAPKRDRGGVAVTDYLNPEQIRDELGLGLSTIYRALESGELPGQKVCGRWRTLRSQLEDRIRDDRVPKPRVADPMPSRHRQHRSSFGDNLVEMNRRRG